MVDQISTHNDINHTKQHIEILVETDGYQVPVFGQVQAYDDVVLQRLNRFKQTRRIVYYIIWGLFQFWYFTLALLPKVKIFLCSN